MRGELYEEDYLEEDIPPLKILVIGCGGGGCNSVHRLHTLGIKGAQTVAINTDRRHLKTIDADVRLLIGAGVTRGLGAGGDPGVGFACARNATEPLNQILAGADLTFVCVGLGGGTGTGAAPVVADLAQRQGSLVITIATTPFEFERSRMELATRSLRQLDMLSDTLLILDNNRLLEMVPNLPIQQAFLVMDTLMSEMIMGLTEAITEPSLINLDFADLNTILKEGGVSTLLYGENADPEAVVSEALDNPLLDMDITGATGALIHITGGSNLTLRRVDRIMKSMTDFFDPNANIICGARVDERYEGQIRVMAVITGIADIIDRKDSLDLDEELEEALVRYDV